MLRLVWRSTSLRPRLLSEDEFIREFEPLAAIGFAGAPPGPVWVEGLDATQRVCWTGHYRSAEGLAALLRQLVEERDKGLGAPAPVAAVRR
jgi:hypothetical protein